MEEIDLEGKYNKDWCDNIAELKRWDQKKPLLEELLKDTEIPKFKPGTYTELSSTVKKMILDSNVPVS